MVKPSYILGLDPGLRITGYGVLELTADGPRVAEAGVLRGPAKGDFAERLKILYEGVVEIIEQWSPSALAIEQLYAHYDHPRTAILMGHARGVFLLAGAQRNIPVVSYAATQVKKLVTGHGRASKEQMQYTILRELRLNAVPEPPDVADALAIALCHYHASTGGGVHGGMGINREMLEPDEDAKG